MSRRCVVVTRTFQKGTRGKEFNWQYFSEIVARQIKSLLTLEVVKGVVVVINGDQENPLSEIIHNGKTPSVIALEKFFPEEIVSGKIVIDLCENWGYSSALNEGIEAGNKFDAELILTLSPEIEIAGVELGGAIEFMTEKKLSVLGFQREGWKVPRNTIALWEFNSLEKIGGFFLKCDDTGKTVFVPEFGEVPLAGMEDFYAVLTMFKELPDFHWGMFGDSRFLKWKVNFPKGSEREYLHLMKVARQEIVSRKYSKLIFPDLSYEQVMEKLFACRCCL